MSIHKKTLVTVLLVGAVIGVFALQTTNTSLFKGQIELKDESSDSGPNNLSDQIHKPDLTADLQVIAPETDGGDLSVSVTIENLGPGAITGDTAFKYAVYLNDEEVFSNIDSYTFMNAGDSFNFIYPVSRPIYQYPDEGTAKIVVDVDNAIKEENETNNEKAAQYFL